MYLPAPCRTCCVLFDRAVLLKYLWISAFGNDYMLGYVRMEDVGGEVVNLIMNMIGHRRLSLWCVFAFLKVISNFQSTNDRRHFWWWTLWRSLWDFVGSYYHFPSDQKSIKKRVQASSTVRNANHGHKRYWSHAVWVCVSEAPRSQLRLQDCTCAIVGTCFGLMVLHPRPVNYACNCASQ